MAARSANSDLRKDVRTLFELGVVANLTDGQLLDQFLSDRGGKSSADSAFGEIIRRHGPMVYRVCQNILNHSQDTQDAVQATFLILVHKAKSIRQKESIASWLYGTATRVARRARADSIRRRHREDSGGVGELVDHGSGDSRQETWAELHEELARLPEKYRVPLVLCYLEGMTTEVVARQLGCPQGTILCRLSRGRDKLRTRLVRRGISASSAMLVLERFSEPTSAVEMPLELVTATVRAALQLAAEGSVLTVSGLVSARGLVLAEVTLRTMLMTKIKLLGLLLLTGGVLVAAVPMPVAMRPQVRAQQAQATRPVAKPSKNADDRWVKKLPNGAVIELVGISTHPSGPKTWWSPDGSPLSEAPYASGSANTYPGGDEQAREFAIRKDVADRDASLKWVLHESKASASTTNDREGRVIPGLEMIAAALSREKTSCAIGIGVASGPWKVEATCGPGGGCAMGFEKIGIVFSPSHEAEGKATIAVSHSALESAVRIVAIGYDEKIYTPSQSSFLSARGVALQTLEFPLGLKSVKEFQFQTRSYEWAEFKDVPLQPRMIGDYPSEPRR